ncbi:MAG TPA: helix-turn-helix domain-containing protein [Ktedonobacterales bacterium]|nr:helix-turn-helix domain-containing protein [Ktedonobacterales bacterium]HEX5571084.1 helix-turn-helix domain-containing protein [Ktedonobacterales bacterium]
MDATEERASLRRPMRADARRNHDLLVLTAARVFEEQGPYACLEDIARSAGVGVGTLYRHFPNRQAILEAVYRTQIDALLAESTALLEASSASEALDAWVRLMLDHIVKQRGLKAALLDSDSPSEVLSLCKRQIRAAGDALIARAQAAGAIRADVRADDLHKLIHGIVQTTPETPEGLEQAHRLIAIMLAGVRAQRP